MFKRVVWTGVGYGLGLGSSVYVQRKVKKTVERYTPEHLRDEAVGRSKEAVNKVRDLGTDVFDVVQRVRAPDFGYDDGGEMNDIADVRDGAFDTVESANSAGVAESIDLRDEPHRSRRRGRGGFNRHR